MINSITVGTIIVESRKDAQHFPRREITVAIWISLTKDFSIKVWNIGISLVPLRDMLEISLVLLGDDLGSLMLRESTMRTEQITCPSLAWLLPSANFWKPSEVLVQTDKFNYTINDFQKLFTWVHSIYFLLLGESIKHFL